MSTPDHFDILPAPANVADEAAKLVRETADHAQRQRGSFTLILAGGSTPKALYERLASEPGPIDWSRVTILQGDERCVGPDHADSNYRMARAALLDRVPIDPARVHRIRGELGPTAAAGAYDGILRATGPADLALLGMGADGHTASLFPGHDFARDAGKLAVPAAAPAGFAIADRVSLTLEALNRSTLILVLITGADKAAALARVRRERLSTAGNDALPMSRVRRGVRFLLDVAAAGTAAGTVASN